MTPHPGFGPYINHHGGEACLMVPYLDAAGALVLHRFPLCLDAAIRLSAQASYAAHTLVCDMRRVEMFQRGSTTAASTSD